MWLSCPLGEDVPWDKPSICPSLYAKKPRLSVKSASPHTEREREAEMQNRKSVGIPGPGYVLCWPSLTPVFPFIWFSKFSKSYFFWKHKLGFVTSASWQKAHFFLNLLPNGQLLRYSMDALHWVLWSICLSRLTFPCMTLGCLARFRQTGSMSSSQNKHVAMALAHGI